MVYTERVTYYVILWVFVTLATDVGQLGVPGELVVLIGANQ